MNDTIDLKETNERRLEIVGLLDERFKLREDPSRTIELEGTHAKLRELLLHGRRSADGER
jgi:hypothetical protein